MLRRRFRWSDAQPPTVECLGNVRLETPHAGLRLERVATVVLLEYAVVWYLCVDVAVLTAAGFLGAVSTLGSLAACRGSAVAVAVLYAVRPYTTLLSQVHTLFSLSLSAVSVWFQVWYLFASARDGADLDALGALLAVSAVCDIVVSAASMLRTLTDVAEALRACRRHVLVLLHHQAGPHIQKSSAAIAVASIVNVSMPAEAVHAMIVKEVDADDDFVLDYDDARFWLSDGSAAVVGPIRALQGHNERDKSELFVADSAAATKTPVEGLDDLRRHYSTT